MSFLQRTRSFCQITSIFRAVLSAEGPGDLKKIRSLELKLKIVFGLNSYFLLTYLL